MTNSVQPSTDRTLGLLADRFDEPYQGNILATFEEATALRGANLIAFGGGIPGSTERDSALRHRAFELPRSENVEGAVLLAGTMVNELGTDALGDLLQQLKHLPLCTIGVEIPGVPSILVDNQSGVDHAMNHLVNHHSCRQVAFIRGPIKNKEAESRFAAYQAALQRANILFDPALVYQGNFLRQAGEAAVVHWRNAGKVPSAIMAANDEMALGAIQALFAIGAKVPEDVRVIGFDDIKAARLMSPPLTTVRQPLKEMAVTAVRTVMDQIHGREVAPVQVLQTHLVIRASCGCASTLTSTGQSQFPDETPRESGNFRKEFDQIKQPLKIELSRITRGEFQRFPNWENQLMEGFVEQIEMGEPTFIQCLSGYLSKVANQGGEASRFQEIITAFRRVALPCCGHDQELRLRCENTVQEARLLTTSAIERVQAQNQMRLEQFTRTLAQVVAALTGSFDIAQFARQLKDQLPRIGVTACYVVLYEPVDLDTETAKTLPLQSRLVAGMVSGGTTGAAIEGRVFKTLELVPGDLLPVGRPHQLTALPLFLKDRELGYCLVECDDAQVAEILREQLSIAVYGCLLAQR